MLWTYCIACFSSHHLRPVDLHLSLCTACLDDLDELRLGHNAIPSQVMYNLNITGLYRYEGSLRQLLLRAKVQGDQRALALLVALAVQRPEVRGLAGWADTIMPAPSSLWGRLRGRHDIASHLASRLAALHARRLVAAPLSLHWRWQKNARKGRSHRAASKAPPPLVWAFSRRRFRRALAAAGKPTHVLLIDDIFTTGATLQRTIQAVQEAASCSVRCLAIASSWR